MHKLFEKVYKDGYEKGLKDAVKHGRWEILGIAIIDTVGRCTNCEGEAVWRTRQNPYAICPNCGAKMDGERREGE